MRLSAPELLGSSPTASEVARAVAVPVYRDELAARLRAGFSLMAGRLGAPGSGSGLLRLMPLGWRVERFAPPEAQVAIWQVVVLAEPGPSRTIATWSTSRLQLRWSAGGWRLAGYLPDEPGPAPAASYPSPATAPGRPAPTVERFRSFSP